MADNKFFFGKTLENINKLKAELPVILANQAQRFFVDSFRQEAWRDGDTQPWAIPKRRIEGTPEYKYPMKKGLGRRTQSTLVQTGRLKRAVNASIRNASFERIQLIVDVPYAGYLNDGTSKMPARPFMKDSLTLRQMQMKKINEYVEKIW